MFFFRWLNQLKILCLKAQCRISSGLHIALRETLTTELFPAKLFSSHRWDTKMFIFQCWQQWSRIHPMSNQMLAVEAAVSHPWVRNLFLWRWWIPVPRTFIQISSGNDGNEYNSKTGITAKLWFFFFYRPPRETLWTQFESANISKTHLEASRVDKDETLYECLLQNREKC